jgi:hypothetical protein
MAEPAAHAGRVVKPVLAVFITARYVRGQLKIW